MMPVLELRFLAGRYHATAWGRNVNEGEPEWPPSPFRIARAFLDIWYRRHPDIDAEDMQAALALLAGQPDMALPEMRPMAVKQYLDQNEKEEKKQAVIDAFAVMERGAKAYLRLPPDASEAALAVLRRLAPELNYLGRSESWVAARVLEAEPSDIVWNCRGQKEGGATAGEPLPCNCLADSAEYDNLPIHPTTGKAKTKRRCTWLEALSLSSVDLQADGWNRHPLAQPCVYHIATEARRPKPSRPCAGEDGLCFTYALRAVPLPDVTRTMMLAERVRLGLMSRHKKIVGDADKVSSLFSGKNRDGSPLQGHRHAFFWPLDLDGDGKLDHIRVLTPQGRKVEADERAALESLRKIWAGTSDLGELILLHALPPDDVLEPVREVESRTPVVIGRHYKKRCGSWEQWLEREIERCCREMGLPAPKQAIWDRNPPKWRGFIRSRKDAPPQPGHGFRLTFAEDVRAPFALGSLAHFGLGLFTRRDAASQKTGQPPSLD